MAKVYLSIDVEASGPVPGLYSMCSLGVAPVILAGTWEVAPVTKGFYAELQPLPGAAESDSAMRVHGMTRLYLEDNGEEPKEAMRRLEDYIKSFKGGTLSGVQVAAKPAAFDFPWVAFYLWKFLGRCCIGHSCLDIGSLARGLTRGGHDWSKEMYRQGFKRFKNPHDHNALWDAVEQAHQLAWLLNRESELRS